MLIRAHRFPRRRVAAGLQFGCLLVLNLLVWPAWSALPSPIKAGHPRLLLSAQQIQQVRSVTAPPLTASFPKNRGRLTFEFVPAFAAVATDMTATPIFDNYDESRNHLFVRHVPQYDDRVAGTVSLQVTIQGPTGYFSNAVVKLKVNARSTVAISWDNTLRRTILSVNDGTPGVQSWGLAAAWRADSQRFIINGRAGERVESVRLDDLDTGAELFRRGPIDLRLQDALQQLVGVGIWGSLDSQVVGLLTCTRPEDVSSCTAPFDLGTKSPGDIEGVARGLAMAFLLTDEPRYLEAARHYAGLLLAVPPSRGGDYAMSGRVAAFSILYDWLFEPMRASAPYASGFSSLADQMAQRMVDHMVVPRENDNEEALSPMVCGNQPVYQSPELRCAVEPIVEWNRLAAPYGPSVAHAYLGGSHAREDGARMAQALLAIADERPDTLPLLETMYRHTDQGYHKAREWLSVDGGHHMNYAYGQNYNNPMYSERLWQAALEPIAGRPVADALWQYKTWLPYLYALRGDMQLPSSGDGFGMFLPDISPFVLRAAVDGGDGHAQTFYDQAILPITQPGAFKTGQAVRYLWDRLFFGPSQTVPRPLEELPLARHFRNAGFVTMRDRWSFADATVLDFKSTSFLSTNHHHFDQNSFSLFYRAPLLVDSGYYDSYGTSHWRNYLIRTVAHNSMVVFDPTETMGDVTSTLSNDGGQWLQAGMLTYPTLAEAQAGPNHLRGVEAFAQGADFSYARGNASLAYSAVKLDQGSGFVRHLAMLRKPAFWGLPVVVVFDQIKLQTGRKSLKPSVLFHTTNEPLASGESARGAGVHTVSFVSGERRVFDVVNGRGRAFIETLAPSNATVRKLGGVGASGDFRFVAPTLAADGSWPLVNYLPGGDAASLNSPDVGAWRIEVSAPGGGLSREFLHVISVADSDGTPGSTPPSATPLNTTGNSAAVLLGGNAVVVIYNSGSSPVYWDLPAGAAMRDVLVLGLQPNERFNATSTPLASGLSRVNLKRSAKGALQATAEGALRYSLP